MISPRDLLEPPCGKLPMPRDQGRRPGRGSYAYDKAHPLETVMEALGQHHLKMGSMREEVNQDRPAPGRASDWDTDGKTPPASSWLSCPCDWPHRDRINRQLWCRVVVLYADCRCRSSGPDVSQSTGSPQASEERWSGRPEYRPRCLRRTTNSPTQKPGRHIGAWRACNGCERSQPGIRTFRPIAMRRLLAGSASRFP